MNIRRFLSVLFLGVALAVNATAPKYIFYFIGDGMGVGAVSLAQTYNRIVLGNDSLLNMMQLPVVSMAFTHSASSPVTDSAAAGTALSTGHKTRNGMLGMNADTVKVTSIASILHDNGYGVELVTTVAPDDATPGSFYAHVPHRSMFYEIGCQAASSGYEFIAGANLRGLRDKEGKDTDLLKVFEDNQVSVVRGLDQLGQTDSRRILLLGDKIMSDNELGFAIDSIEGQMTLKDMTEACLSHLLANTPRFFMMVEGGSIDHSGHANDAATNAKETLNFDNALGVALDFYKAHPDETLIVVTADHETGGLILANSRLHYDIQPKYLQYVRMSKDAFSDHCKSLLRSRMVITWEDMKSLLSERLGLYSHIPVNDAENAMLREKFDHTFRLRSESDVEGMYNSFNSFAESVYDLISDVSGIGWTTHDHSGTPVPVFAIGVDSDRFAKIQDNTDIPKKILSIAELGE